MYKHIRSIYIVKNISVPILIHLYYGICIAKNSLIRFKDSVALSESIVFVYYAGSNSVKYYYHGQGIYHHEDFVVTLSRVTVYVWELRLCPLTIFKVFYNTKLY